MTAAWHEGTDTTFRGRCRAQTLMRSQRVITIRPTGIGPWSKPPIAHWLALGRTFTVLERWAFLPDLRIEEYYIDTAGSTDHAFALCHLLGFRFAPHLADKRL